MSSPETITVLTSLYTFHITETGYDFRVDSLEAKTEAAAKRTLQKSYPLAKLKLAHKEPARVMRQTTIPFD